MYHLAKNYKKKNRKSSFFLFLHFFAKVNNQPTSSGSEKLNYDYLEDSRN